MLKAVPKTKDYLIIPHGHSATFHDVPNGDLVVFFVRDPVSRFVSGFYSRQRQGLPAHNSPWNVGEKVAFDKFATANDLAEWTKGSGL